MDTHALIVLLLRATSGLCWTAVYVRVIQVGLRDRTCGLPALALCANLAWEGVFGYLLDYGPGAELQQRINQVWFLFDIGIAWLYVRYGNPGETFPATQRGRALWLAFGTIALAAIMHRAGIEHGVQTAARPAALIQNLMMSILFVEMLRRSGQAAGQAIDIGLLKLTGTVAAVIYLTMNTGSVLVALIGIAIAGYDTAYVTALAGERRRARQMRTTRTGAEAAPAITDDGVRRAVRV